MGMKEKEGGREGKGREGVLVIMVINSREINKTSSRKTRWVRERKELAVERR